MHRYYHMTPYILAMHRSGKLKYSLSASKASSTSVKSTIMFAEPYIMPH